MKTGILTYAATGLSAYKSSILWSNGPGADAATWADVMNFVATSSPNLAITTEYVPEGTGDMQIPAGVYDMRHGRLGGEFIGSNGAGVVADPGVVLHDLDWITSTLLHFNGAGASPKLTWTDPGPGNAKVFFTAFGGGLRNDGSVPVIVMDPSTFLIIGSLLGAGGISPGASPAVRMQTGCVLVGVALSNSTGNYPIPADSVTSDDNTALLGFAHDGWFRGFPLMPGFTGTMVNIAFTQDGGSGPTAARPVALFGPINPGTFYWDTDLGREIVWDGAAWVVSGFPVSDAIFGVTAAADATKLLNVDASGQAPATTTTIKTSATISRPFTLPDISGTAVVQEDPSGFVFMGATAQLHGSNAGMQYSTVFPGAGAANRAQLRCNLYGANGGSPGVTGFKSTGATIGSLGGCAGGDKLWRMTAIGVTPDNLQIPLAALLTAQVPAGFVAAGQNYLPSELELQLVPLLGPTNGVRVAFKVSSEGETQTLSGVRAGGPQTTPATISTAGSLWSSGTGDPEGVITGSPGDLFSRTDGGAKTCFYVKESGVATNMGWVGK